ncbi:hypothetical protein D3C77_681040 [compost metagenome]
MKDTIRFNAKKIRDAAAQGSVSAGERLGLMVLHDYIVFAAHDRNVPEDVREYAQQQLVTLPQL